MTMTRKQFLRTIVGAGVGAVGVSALVACGDDGGGVAADAPPPTCNQPGTVIAGNHGHVMAVSMADAIAMQAKSYDITGTAGHMHSVMISAAQFTMLKNGATLSLTSTSGNSHTHQVTVVCTT